MRHAEQVAQLLIGQFCQGRIPPPRAQRGVTGDAALPPTEKWVATQFNYLRACTIYGGSNEIQKNIISKHILQLPSA